MEEGEGRGNRRDREERKREEGKMKGGEDRRSWRSDKEESRGGEGRGGRVKGKSNGVLVLMHIKDNRLSIATKVNGKTSKLSLTIQFTGCVLQYKSYPLSTTT